MSARRVASLRSWTTFVAALVAIVTSIAALPTPVLGGVEALRVEQVTIRTLPEVSGVRVRLDGKEGVTDSDGIVRLERTRYVDVPAAEVEVLDAAIAIDDRSRARVARIFGASGVNPTIALDVDFAVGFEFDSGQSSGTPVTDLGTFATRSSVGEVKEMAPEDVEWFHGQRVVQLNGALEVKDLYWTVQSLDFHGSNLVNRSQQRFEPARTSHVEIELLFFTATFRSRDALFFHPQGNAIELTYPDGFVRQIDLDGQGRATVGGLPRGEYQVRVIGGGPSMSQPVTITRGQDIDFKVLSWLDIGVFLGGGLVFALGLLVAGGLAASRRARSLVPVAARAFAARMRASTPVAVDEAIPGRSGCERTVRLCVAMRRSPTRDVSVRGVRRVQN